MLTDDAAVDPEPGKDGTEKSGKIRNQQERQTKVLQLAREGAPLLTLAGPQLMIICSYVPARAHPLACHCHVPSYSRKERQTHAHRPH